MLEVGQSEGRNRELMLTIEPKWGAACCQHLQTMSPRNKLRYGGCRSQNLLEVVEHQEQPSLAKVVLEGLTERLLPNLLHPQRLCYGREEQFSFGQGGELREESTVWEVIQEVRCRLQGN